MTANLRMKALRIASVERRTVGGAPCWAVSHDVTTAAGDVERHAHVFPDSIFEWRVAEYELDPTDIQTLLDIVIHEPHLPAGWDQGPDFLHRAPDRATARDAHLARIAACKATLGTNSDLPKVHDPNNPHPLHHVAATVVIDPAGVTAKHRHIAILRGEITPPPPPPPRRVSMQNG